MTITIKTKDDVRLDADFTDVSLAPETLRREVTPSFLEAYEAAARNESALGSAVTRAIDYSNDATDDERAAAEERDNEILANAGFFTGMAAVVLQPENIALAGLTLVPGFQSLAGPTLAARVGRVAAFTTAIAGQEAAMHATQKTRTLEESTYNTAGALLFGGAFEGAGAALSRLKASRAAAGTSLQADVARDVQRLAAQSIPNTQTAMPSSVVVDDLLTPKAPIVQIQGGQDSVGAMRVSPDTIRAMDETPTAPGAMEIDSKAGSGIVAVEKAITDKTTKALSTWGTRVMMQPFETARSIAAKLLPIFERTGNVIDNSGQHMDLHSYRRSFEHGFKLRAQRINDEGFNLFKQQLKHADVQQLAGELVERAGMSADDALAKARQIKASKSDKSLRGQFTELVTFAGRNADQSSISAVGRTASRFRQEVLTPIVQRGAKYGVYNADWLTAGRDTAKSYWMRKWDKRKLSMQRDQFLNDMLPYIENTDKGRTLHGAVEDLRRSITDADELTLIDMGNGAGLKIGSKLVLTNIPDNVAARYLDNDSLKLVHQYIRRGGRDVSPAELWKTADWQEQLNVEMRMFDREYTNKLAALKAEITDPAKLATAVAKLEAQSIEARELIEYAKTHAVGTIETSGNERAVRDVAGAIQLTNLIFGSMGDLAAHKMADVVTKVLPSFVAEVLHPLTSRLVGDSTMTALRREQGETIGYFTEHIYKNRYTSGMYETAAELEYLQMNKAQLIASKMREWTYTYGQGQAWSNTHKRIVGEGLVNDTVAFLKGTYKPTELELQDWARHSFGTTADSKMLAEISAEINQHASQQGKLWFANPDKWTNQEAADFYKSFVTKYTESRIVTANPSTVPLGAQGIGLMPFLAQYLSWSTSYIDRLFKPTIEAGAQESAKYMLKMSMFVFAGEYMREIAKGRDPADVNTDAVLVKALQQTQVLPFTFVPLLNRLTSQATPTLAEMTGVQDLKYLSRTMIPAEDVFNRASKITKQVVTGDIREDTILNIESFIPGLNLWWATGIRNATADLIADEFDLPQKQEKR